VLPDTTDFRVEKGFKDSAVLQRPLGKTIMTGFWLRELPGGELKAYGKQTRSLAKINEELGEQCIGPILAYGMDWVDYEPHKPVDLDMCDFRHLVDFLRARHDVARYQRDKAFTGPSVTGVRVTCKGDQVVFKYPKFEASHMPADLFEGAGSAKAVQRTPARVGLELVIAKFPEALAWRRRRVGGMVASGNWVFTCEYLLSHRSSSVNDDLHCKD
jgi:hypothetical protein